MAKHELPVKLYCGWCRKAFYRPAGYVRAKEKGRSVKNKVWNPFCCREHFWANQHSRHWLGVRSN